MRTLFRRAAALTILATLTLAGCGGNDSEGGDGKPDADSTSSAPGSDVEPADGKTFEGKGYSFTAPEGWDKPEQAIPGTEATDTFAADLDDKDGFADNINVLRRDAAPPEPFVEFKDQLAQQLKDAGLKEVAVKETGTIDGEDYVHISSAQELNGNKNGTEQYFVEHDGASYIVTLSFSTDVSEDDRDETAASVLATWKWAS